MNCARLRQVLDAYVDRELDTVTTEDIDRHLAGCPDCAALRAERDALRDQIRAEAPYYAAPEALRRAVHGALAGAAVAPPARGARHISWLHAGGFALAAAAAGLAAGLWLARAPAENPLREQVVASHVASLAPERGLTDIASADRHVVKPWFAGKTDFAPLVRDLSDAGFALVGARLDHVADRQAAAVVYRIRNHYVNLFIWRGEPDRREAVSVATVRGFGVATWAEGGLRFAAVSDVDQRDLVRFAEVASAALP